MVVFDRLWSGRAITELKYVFLFFYVCLHVSLCVSNHFNHCIKLFAPCGTLIGNKKKLFLFFMYEYAFLCAYMYIYMYICILNIQKNIY
jgi:hypothetical protein